MGAVEVSSGSLYGPRDVPRVTVETSLRVVYSGSVAPNDDRPPAERAPGRSPHEGDLDRYVNDCEGAMGLRSNFVTDLLQSANDEDDGRDTGIDDDVYLLPHETERAMNAVALERKVMARLAAVGRRHAAVLLVKQTWRCPRYRIVAGRFPSEWAPLVVWMAHGAPTLRDKGLNRCASDVPRGRDSARLADAELAYAKALDAYSRADRELNENGRRA